MAQETTPAANAPASGAPEQITVETRRSREITRGNLSKELESALVTKEGVHPLDNVAELVRTRIAPASDPVNGGVWDKHCYGFYTPDDNTTPKVVVYVKLVRLPETNGKIENSDLPGNISEILKRPVQLIQNPNAAIFYTITNISKNKAERADGQVSPKDGKAPSELPMQGNQDNPAKNSVSPAEQLIKEVAGDLKKNNGIKCFSTLSPLRVGIVSDRTNSTDTSSEPAEQEIPGFSKWLSEFLKEAKDKPIEEAKDKPLLTKEEKKLLSEAMLWRSYEKLTDKEHEAIEPLIKHLAFHYITQEKAVGGKNPNDPKDNVAKFHLGNGAEVANIHYITPKAGATLSDKEGAYGLMVNYRYDLDKVEDRKAAFKNSGTIAVDPVLAETYKQYNEQRNLPKTTIQELEELCLSERLDTRAR